MPIDLNTYDKIIKDWASNIIKDFDKPYIWPSWLLSKLQKAVAECDCGALKCKTTHANWCSTMSKV